MPDHGEVMRHEEERDPELPLDVLEQVDHLRLDRHVSAETGSSATSTFGCSVSARAMPMRWRWPPENSCGWRL